MKAIDKESGCLVDIINWSDNPVVEIMKDGVMLYRKMDDLELKESISLNDVVKVTLTRDGAYYLNHKGKKRKDGKKFSKGDEYVTVMWKLYPTFREFYHPGADAPFKNMQCI